MSRLWNDLLPSLLDEFSDLALQKSALTPEREKRLKAIQSSSGDNCQVIFSGLAALANAFVHSREELSESEQDSLGYLIQYLAALGADLADIHSNTFGYLSSSKEVADA